MTGLFFSSLFFLIQLQQIIGAHIIQCQPSHEEIINLEIQYGVRIHGVDLKISHEEKNAEVHLAKYYSDVAFNDLNVDFSGYITKQFLKSHKKSFVSFIIPHLTVKKDNSFNNCSSTSSAKYLRNELPNVTISVISQMVKNCISIDLCQNINKPKSKARKIVRRSTLIVDNEAPINECELRTSSNIYNPTSTLNKVLDFVLAYLIRTHTKNGVFSIPDLHIKNGIELTAVNGTFSNLTTLGRSEDLFLENDRRQFIIGTKFKLPDAVLIFEKYTARPNIWMAPKVSGKMKATFKDLWMKIKVVMDYNVQPCQMTLIDFDMGGVPTLKMSGFSIILNSVVSSTINLGVKMFLNNGTKNGIKSALQNFKCEQLRP